VIAPTYDERCVVVVEGDLEQREQRWVLDDPDDIVIVPVASDDERCRRSCRAPRSPGGVSPVPGARCRANV